MFRLFNHMPLRCTQAPRRRLRSCGLWSAWLLLLAGCSIQPPALPSSAAVPPTFSASPLRAAQAPTTTPTARPAPTATILPTVRPTATATVTPTSAPDTATPTSSDGATATPTDLVPRPTPTLAALDLARRTELFDKVWNLINERYFYADFGGVDWQAIKQQYQPRALAAPTTDAFYATLTEMVDELRDQHSRFENPQEAFVQQAAATGQEAYVGVGILAAPVDEGLLVTTVFKNSPASEAGIRRRDMIVAVNGAPVNVDASGINGPAGTTVQVEIRTPDGVVRTITLARRAVLAQYLPEVYVLPGTRTGYVLIQSFWLQDMAERTQTALQALLADNGGRLDGLIVDLRGNGGGWRNVLQGLLANFVQGDVGMFYSQENSYPFTITPGPLYESLKDVPLVVLVDQETKSYAEVFTAALQAQGRAQVVGVKTAGNTETIFAYDLDDGSRVWIAQEGFKLPDGSDLEGRGVQPDQVINVDWSRFSEARDPQITAAIGLIRQRAGAQPKR